MRNRLSAVPFLRSGCEYVSIVALTFFMSDIYSNQKIFLGTHSLQGVWRVSGWKRWRVLIWPILLSIGSVAALTWGVWRLSENISQQVRQCLSHELQQQAVALHSWLAEEAGYLRDEALLLAHYEDLFTWLAQGDVERLRRFLALHQTAHKRDQVYILTAPPAIYTAAPQISLADADLRNLDVVQRGWQGQTASEFIAMQGHIWLLAVAPHTAPQGQVDAVVVIAHQFDAVTLEDLARGFGGTLLLTDAQETLVIAGQAIPPPVQKEIQQTLAHRATYWQSFFLSHQGRVYGVISVPLGPTDEGVYYSMALIKPAEILEHTYHQARWGAMALATALIALTTSVLVFHYWAVFTPLQALQRVTERIAQGNLGLTIPTRGTSVLRALAQNIDTMRRQVRNLLESERSLRQALAQRLEHQSGTLVQMCREREDLLTRLITAQEEERRRVARELHDETSQELANLIVRLGALGRQTEDPHLQQQLRMLREHVARTLEGVNRIVLDLRPGLLDEYGLLPAVRWYAEERLRAVGVEVQTEVHGTPHEFPPVVQTTLYRVLQEAINNIARHAQAQHARLVFQWQPQALHIEIHDDGRGFTFDPHHLATAGHFGLLGMRERLNLIHASLEVRTAPGQGTHLFITVPYDPNQPTPGAAHGQNSRAAGG